MSSKIPRVMNAVLPTGHGGLDPITRESLLRDDVRDWGQEYGHALPVLSSQELHAHQETTLASAPDPDNIWVFAYGSLLWNPVINFVEQRVGTVYGYHRSFCLHTVVSRGTPDAPGLMLGLESGGACRSPAYRIAAETRETEITLLFRREMMTNVYRAKWVWLHSEGAKIPVLAFVMNRRHSLYVGKLSASERVRIIASAHGSLGRCSGYLFQTLESLRALGIRDRRLENLAARVRNVIRQ